MRDDDDPNFEAALGVEDLNLAAQHGRKIHPGRRLSEGTALVIFFGNKQSSVHLWNLEAGRSVSSEVLPKLLDPLFIEDDAATEVIEAFRRLAPEYDFDLYPGNTGWKPECEQPVSPLSF
ncbi:hypothetical protein AYJ57_20455 (plasmid) [Salipiger sp. CCB-MM3]|uniref:hypothetical protein n=1 Tax=Salipiger sp. CCB-MM3 TaxID=1792508 RepID=UPI00080ABC7D|nr:hypothetical protein [Salipiger sp. CCB-MM3]ANT62863.1 hypothetical protein AYJ57_20455 [Salipiger sp. CCB-MM3]